MEPVALNDVDFNYSIFLQKYSELIALYRGKKMHEKALGLLRR